MCRPFDPLPLTSKGYFQSPISNFESPLTKGRVKLTPKKTKTYISTNHQPPLRKVWSLLAELEENIAFFVNKFNFTT